MAELQSKKKSFNQAFAEARKRGESKFQWNGAWYSTQTSEEKNVQTKGGIDKADYKQKMANRNGTVSNRFTVRHKNDVGYYVWDNDLQRQVGNAFKNKQDAAKYITSADVKNKYDEGFMIDAGEATVTAARTKLNRKTAGFQPVDSNKNFVDKEGNTRLYQERGTGRYLVTDNKGNIVGYSFDPAAATADGKWGGWIAYTGSKNDIKAAEAGKLRDEANRNEVNQKSKQAKDRKVNEWDRQIDGIRRMQGGFNTIQGMLNIPNNIITGAIRAGVSDDYSWDDYKDSFTIDGLWRGNSSVGLGDILEIDNGYGRFAANMINPMAVFGTAVKSSTPTYKVGATEGKPIVIKSQSAGPTKSNFRRGSRPNEGMGTNQRGQTQYGGKHNASSNVGPVETTKIPTQRYYIDKTPGQFSPTPFNAAFRYDPKVTYVYSDGTPTANFWYSGEGNPNTYAQGRIVTGEVVPGTSGENWNGGVSGGAVVVDNTNGQVAPAFGGVTVGGGRDNQSGWYLPLAYKKGGKAKLISKKR